MTFAEQCGDDVEAMEADLPESFTYLAVDYIGSIGSLHDSHTMTDDSYFPTAGAVLTVRLAVFGNVTPPALDALLTIRGKICRIASIERHTDGVTVDYALVKNI